MAKPNDTDTKALETKQESPEASSKKATQKYFAKKVPFIGTEVYACVGNKDMEPFEIKAAEIDGWVELSKAQYDYLKKCDFKIADPKRQKPHDEFEFKTENN
jgi:hypothetical protein